MREGTSYLSNRGPIGVIVWDKHIGYIKQHTMNALLNLLGNFLATYLPKTPYGVHGGELVK